MSQPFIGEIRMGGWNFAPVDFALCNGQLVAISQNDTLFQLIGTTYGGDGVNTFALPDLQGRLPIHQGTDPRGNSYIIGERAGVETVTLLQNQIPAHSHTLNAQSGLGNQPSPSGGFWAESSLDQFSSNAPTVAMAPSVLGLTGGNQPHDNVPPFLVINFVISLFGIFPSQS